jgi:hypothetical protein
MSQDIARIGMKIHDRTQPNIRNLGDEITVVVSQKQAHIGQCVVRNAAHGRCSVCQALWEDIDLLKRCRTALEIAAEAFESAKSVDNASVSVNADR